MDKEYHRQYSREHYLRNKGKYSAKARSRQKELSAYVRQLKTWRYCSDCGISYPYYVMDFDHRDPKEKVAVIPQLVRAGVSKARIDAEIAKCDLVCANCHRERTHGDLRGTTRFFDKDHKTC